jgi:GNAT superfamily N-acetyltransferase
MGIEIELREVGPDDPDALELLAAGRAEIAARKAEEPGGEPRPPLNVAMRSDTEILVAYAGEAPVGLGCLRTVGLRTGEIKRMYVIPAHRGAGVGRRLLEELDRRARELGFEAVRLDTHDRLVEANRLYAAVGYREIPDYNSNPRANRWFEKRLA